MNKHLKELLRGTGLLIILIIIIHATGCRTQKQNWKETECQITETERGRCVRLTTSISRGVYQLLKILDT
jgi:hypothetical protein